MADKTIGELPSLNTMEADTLIPVEHDGAAKSMSGTVLQNYIYSNVEDDVEVIAAQIATGPKGDDGVSPTVSTTKQNGVATVNITDADGDHTFTVNDGDVSKEFISSSSASGAIANFWRPAGGIPVNSLVCDINPVQAGSGDPSPTNIRAISGWTGVNVARTGKNLCPRLTGRTINGVTFTEQPDGSMTVVGTASSEALNAGAATSAILADYPLLPPGDYVVKGPTAARYYVVFRDKAANAVNVEVLSTHNLLSNFSVTANVTVAFRVITPCCAYLRVDVLTSDGAVNMTAYPQIEAGDTPSAYEPYQGSTYPISLGRTVYGGKLNVTTGKLTVTQGYIASYSGQTLPGKWIADRAVYAAGTTPPTGAQVVYELVEPETYQLTPQEVASLLGENNIWADCGNVEVTFGEDIKDYLDKKGTGIPAAEKGQPEGVATLDDYGVLSGVQSSSRLQRFEHDTTLSSEHNGVFGVCQVNDITITVPDSLPDERFELTLFRWQSKTVTITPAAGVTINASSNSKTITTTFGAVFLKKLTETVWIILGDYT